MRIAGKSNCGVCTDAKELLAVTSITESEENVDMRYLEATLSQDADESSAVSTPPNINTRVSSSDTSEANYYHMKTLSRKGRKDRPSKIEFQQLKPTITRNFDKYSRKRLQQHDKSRKRIDYERHRVAINEIPSKTVLLHNLPTQVESYQSSLQFQHPPNSFRARWQNMLSRFKRRPVTNRSQCPKTAANLENGLNCEENTKIYHFDRGEPTYFRTTDRLPHLASDIYAERVNDYFTKFWAEVFGSINIVVTFLSAFLIQFYRFILYSICRALVVGLLQTTSDYLLKPILAVGFNGFLQPMFTLLQNIFQSICDMFGPLTELIGNIVSQVMRPITECVGAFRFVEIKQLTEKQPSEYRQPTLQGHENV